MLTPKSSPNLQLTIESKPSAKKNAHIRNMGRDMYNHALRVKMLYIILDISTLKYVIFLCMWDYPHCTINLKGENTSAKFHSERSVIP